MVVTTLSPPTTAPRVVVTGEWSHDAGGIVTALLAGVDWSSKALHAALIPLDPDHDDETCPPVTFRSVRLPPLLGDGIHRIRSVRQATRELLVHHPNEVHTVWIEEAYGQHRNTDRVLLPIYGAIVASVPLYMTVAGLRAYDWRQELGLRIGAATSAEAKAEAHTYALDWLSDNTPASLVDGVPTKAFRMPDEHEVDSLCIALAARQILHREAAA